MRSLQLKVSALLMSLLCSNQLLGEALQGDAEASALQWLPLQETTYHHHNYGDFEGPRRKLTPFEVCSGCTCCAGKKGGGGQQQEVCSRWACCYSITCGLPDKPFGVCAFTPKSCNCTSCGGATTRPSPSSSSPP
eukprot:TRINITY_DN3937_c0_g1_i1.p1 TRINITY_DN3937_c0_g1~~TRINITY_DN3937_c0_g1_i1.p1  ORF type:complete len:135 (+),score=24.79 TRINITY_DN3937_c0_g1_i1:311-715(+)